MDPVAAHLSALSAREMVIALRADRLPRVLAAGIERSFRSASVRLGVVLADFANDIAPMGIARAAERALVDLGVRSAAHGRVREHGAALVASNHPGAYDALCLLAAIGRDDVQILAAERPFLKGLPGLAPHLILVAENDDSLHNLRALIAARRHLLNGGLLLHFGAGKIEPDPAFPPLDRELLLPWHSGTGMLGRLVTQAGGSVHVASVRGVHSAFAKWLPPVRLAERYGVTTLAPLLQVAYRPFRSLAPHVRIGAALEPSVFAGSDNARIAASMRERALQLTVMP
jgi:hypothetical protein